MTSRTLKLLTASTAFVAAASVGNAVSDTISVSQTTTLEISNTTAGILTIDSSASVVVTGAAAIQISDSFVVSDGTGADTAAEINVGTDSTVSSDFAGGTIGIMADSSVTGIVINNSGTIVNTGSGAAISSTLQNAAGDDIGLTVNNVGTISGSIDAGAGQFTYTGTGATQNGDMTTTSTATDAVTLTDSTMTGDISLGDGTNNVIISDSTLTGNYTGGAGNDSVTVKDDSTVTGNIAFGAGGTDALTVSGSRINGNISNGAGSDLAITLTNGIISGTIIDSSGDADDSLTINGENTFTTYGVITGFEDLNINTDMVVNHAITGAVTLDLAADKTLSANENITASGLLTNDGTVNIAAGKVVTAGTYTGTGTLGFAITSSNTTSGMGQLSLTGGTVAAGTSVTINMANTSGFIASGTQYVIVNGTGTAGVASLTTDSSGVYRYSTEDSSGDLLLTVGRVDTADVVAGSDNKSVAAVLDTLGADATGELYTVQGQIGSQATAGGVQNVLESLTPSIDGAGIASVNFAVDAGNQISNRLASVRSTGYGVATGDAMASNFMWAQGFGSTVEQDDKNGQRGYDASSAGASIGMDTDTLVDGATTGLAFTYGKSSVDSNASGGASTDIDTYGLTAYGSRMMDNGVFVNGQLGFGYNQYEMERTVAGVGRTSGDTNGWQTTAKVEAGRDYDMGGLTLTPLASLQYTYLDMDSYTETGAGGASLRVNPESMSTVDAGAGAEMSYAMPLSDGGTLKPTVRAKYIYRMGDRGMGTTSQFVGGGTAFNTSGVESDRSSVNLGAGLLLTTVGGTDLSLNYDADIRSSLTGHTGQLKARWAF